MEHNNFENNFKTSFEQYRPELDHDEIWNTIEPKLKKKKKRRFLFFWFLFAGLGFFTIGYNFNAISTPTAADTTQPMTSSEAPETTVSAPAPSPKMDASITDQLEQEVRTTATSNDIPTSNPSNFTTKKGNKVSDIKALNAAVITTQKVTTEAIAETQATSPRGEELIEEQTNSDAINEEGGKGSKEEGSEEDREKEMKEEEKEEESSEKKKAKKAKRKKIKPYKNKRRYFIQPSAGIIAPFKLLTATSGEGGYLEKRKETEKQLEAFAIGLDIQMQTKKGLILAAGLEFQQLNERFDRYEETQTTQTITGTLTVTENGQGQIINTTTGPIPIVRTSTKRQRFYNHHTFINLPIGIGKFWHHRKYDFKLLGGVDFNLYHNFSGVLINPELEIIDLRRRSPARFSQIFKRKTGLGLWISAAYHRPINRRLSWFIAPKLQIPFGTITQDDYRLKHRYIRLNFNVGLSCLIEKVEDKVIGDW